MSRARAWLASPRGSAAVYAVMAAAVRRRDVGAGVREEAFRAGAAIWERAMWIEGCGAALARALRTTAWEKEAPGSVQRLLGGARSDALRRAALAHRQLAEVAQLAAAHAVRVMVLKGAARQLTGELPGSRGMADIDLLVPPGDVARFHALLRGELGYRAHASGPRQHLPALSRDQSLDLEVHGSLGVRPQPLDDVVWRDTRTVSLAGAPLECPSPTAMLLHVLEHAIVLHWSLRYRLRDVLDVAECWTTWVDESAVGEHVHRAAHRAPLEILLSAAHEIEARVPAVRPDAWRVVSRVGRTRLAAAAVPGASAFAVRSARVASVLAEASPRSAMRGVWRVVSGPSSSRRIGRRAVLAAGAVIAGGCSSSTAPAAPVTSPAFVYVADISGHSQLFLFDGDSSTQLTTGSANVWHPAVSGGQLVFTTDSLGHPQLVVSDLQARAARTVAPSSGVDDEAALSPAGDSIVFVSDRSGTPRIWLVGVPAPSDSTGGSAAPLATGSAGGTPERAPAWSPAGGSIAFTSTRTGTSQLFVASSGGGAVVQLTHEATGAFHPAWAADGSTIAYVTGNAELRTVSVATGATRQLDADTLGDGDPACDATLCLAVTSPGGSGGDVIVLPVGGGAGGSPQVVLPRSRGEREPALLHP